MPLRLVALIRMWGAAAPGEIEEGDIVPERPDNLNGVGAGEDRVPPNRFFGELSQNGFFPQLFGMLTGDLGAIERNIRDESAPILGKRDVDGAHPPCVLVDHDDR